MEILNEKQKVLVEEIERNFPRIMKERFPDGLPIPVIQKSSECKDCDKNLTECLLGEVCPLE